jgi:pre-mRNA-splicing helicase BRR2
MTPGKIWSTSTQSAGLILRAIFEICLKRGWAILELPWIRARRLRRGLMWRSMTPLRQFKGVPAEIIRKRKTIPMGTLLRSPPEIGELLGIPNNLLHRLVHNFPHVTVASASTANYAHTPTY